MIYFAITMVCFHCFVVGSILTNMAKETNKLPSVFASWLHAAFVVWGLIVIF